MSKFEDHRLLWTAILGRFEAHSHQTYTHQALVPFQFNPDGSLGYVLSGEPSMTAPASLRFRAPATSSPTRRFPKTLNSISAMNQLPWWALGYRRASDGGQLVGIEIVQYQPDTETSTMYLVSGTAVSARSLRCSRQSQRTRFRPVSLVLGVIAFHPSGLGLDGRPHVLDQLLNRRSGS